MKILRALSLTLFVFGLLGWIYIVVNSEVHLWTLAMPLTHFLPYPREDTSGEISFLVSMASFFVWNLVKDKK
jgi:heme O synthase-like polyprenyltransferase